MYKCYDWVNLVAGSAFVLARARHRHIIRLMHSPPLPLPIPTTVMCPFYQSNFRLPIPQPKAGALTFQVEKQRRRKAQGCERGAPSVQQQDEEPAMGRRTSHTTRKRECCRRRTVFSLTILFSCLMEQVKASPASPLHLTPQSVTNATILQVNETLPLHQQEKNEEDHNVLLEASEVQDLAEEVILSQREQKEDLHEPQEHDVEQEPRRKGQKEQQPPHEVQGAKIQEEQQPPWQQKLSQEQQPPPTELEAQDAQVEGTLQQHDVPFEEGSVIFEEGVSMQISEEAVKEAGLKEEENPHKEKNHDMEIINEEDEEEHEAAERDSLEEIKAVIEAQAEEDRRLSEDAALDEARAHAAEREAVRQEAEEKRQTRIRAAEAHAGAASWGREPRQGDSRGSSSSSSNGDSGNISGSGNRGNAFAALSGGGSGGVFSRVGGLGRASHAGSSASSTPFTRRGRVPPTDEHAQAEMMSAAFGGGAGGPGTISFEDMMTQQERSMHGGSGDESATVRARLAAKLVLETDALLYGGQGGSGGAGLEIGDDDPEEEEGGMIEGKKAALLRDRTGKEIARILREGEKDDPNWYAVLGISRRASAQTVKDSFRRLVLLIHPDKTASRGAQEAFQLVQEAYESLSGPSERRAYDLYLVKLRTKHWKQRIRPLKDKLDELSDYYEPVLERKGKIALGAFLVWALVL